MIEIKNLPILVTGHTGFKGLWLSALLNMDGAKVYGVSNEDNFKAYKNLRTRVFEEEFFLDVANFEALERVVRYVQPSFIFHLAAQPLVQYGYDNPLVTFQSNSIGTLNVLEIIRRFRKIPAIIITTDKVYNNDESGLAFSESDRIWGKDPYSASKAICEQLIDCYRRCYEQCFDIYTARAGNVIGGGDYSEDRLMPDVYRSIYTEKALRIRNPNSTRPWQHVLEPIFGYYLYMSAILDKKLNLPGSLNFGPQDKDNCSVSEVIKIVKEKLPLDVEFEEKITSKQTAAPNYEAQKLSLNSSLASTVLNWKSKLRIDQAVHNTLREYSMLENNVCTDQVYREAIKGYLNV